MFKMRKKEIGEGKREVGRKNEPRWWEKEFGKYYPPEQKQ